VGGGRVSRKDEGERIWLIYFVFMYQKITMKPVELGEDEGEGWRGGI
jgi:hypothetical protein